jgi:hypothetical protein
VNKAAKYSENRFNVAGLAQMGDASKAFGLFPAAGIVKRRNHNHRNRRPFVSQPALRVEAGHPAEVHIQQQSDWGRRPRRGQKLFGGPIDCGLVSPGAQHSSERLLGAGVVFDDDDKAPSGRA